MAQEKKSQKEQKGNQKDAPKPKQPAKSTKK